MTRPLARLPHLFLIGALAVALLIARNWAYVTTYRLYLNQRVDDASRSAAAQRFDIEGIHVVPQIAMRDDDRVAFTTAIGQSSTFRVQVRPIEHAHYEIRWRDSAGDRVLSTGDVTAPTNVTSAIPAGGGRIELVSHGSLTWIDPRFVRDFRVAPHVLLLAALLAGAVACAHRRRAPPAARDARDRVVWFGRFALAGSVVISLVVLEGGLRALGDRIPGGIGAQRHDLGEVQWDPRWEDSLRFGRRLRPNIDAVNEWRQGDIVRMGFIPPAVSDGLVHRYPFRTDDEGFRNARVRDRIDVAALGDSFTDAMTVPIEDAWATRLERRTGLAVQNYGTAGFGPQQELRVLKDYAVRHHPRVVVLAYFAGNDLFDAEAFDDFDRSGGAIRRPVPGWRIKDVVSRFDTWFVVSAARAATTWMSTHERAEARTTTPTPAPARDDTVATTRAMPSFDRGMFTVAVNGRPLRWAFMPPYLNTLNFSERDLAARKGWVLTRRTIEEMRDVSRDAGAELVVMFLPFKSQVYLPLLERAFSGPDLARAIQFSLPDNASPPDLAAMSLNRLAQNALMRRLCVEDGIRCLDTTDALQARVWSGENVYFPDESHLNETGHAVVADALAAFLGSSVAGRP
jgi:hypothetical protein